MCLVDTQWSVSTRCCCVVIICCLFGCLQVFSNLPGPTTPMFFSQERVLGLQVMFPNLIPQVLIISYNNGIFCNMSVDPELVDECDKLPQLFLDELTEVAQHFGINTDRNYMIQSRQ